MGRPNLRKISKDYRTDREIFFRDGRAIQSLFNTIKTAPHRALQNSLNADNRDLTTAEHNIGEAERKDVTLVKNVYKATKDESVKIFNLVKKETVKDVKVVIPVAKKVFSVVEKESIRDAHAVVNFVTHFPMFRHLF